MTISIKTRPEDQEVFQQIKNSNACKRFKICEELVKDQVRLSYLLDSWLLLLRDGILLKQNLSDLVISQDSKEIEKILKSYTTAEITNLIMETKKTKEFLQQNINPRLALENLALII